MTYPQTTPSTTASLGNPASASKLTLQERVAAAQHRIAEGSAPAREKARDITTQAKDFVVAHPMLSVAGGLAAGAAVALMLPGRPGRRVRGRVLGLGGLLGELAATYGSRMLEMAEDAAHVSQEKLEEIGESFTETGERVARLAVDASEGAANTVAHASEAARRQTQALAARIRR